MSERIWYPGKFLERLVGRSSKNPTRYTTLPEKCVCHECGYTVTSPGDHCPALGACPVCGSPRLWRG